MPKIGSISGSPLKLNIKKKNVIIWEIRHNKINREYIYIYYPRRDNP